MSKIALAMIVKGSDDEAHLLDRCLENVSPYVDGIFITSTHMTGMEPNKHIDEVVSKYNGSVSYFEWVKDFAAARNYNFSQVPKEYDYILWCDADDLFRGLEKLKPTIEANPTVDALAFWYLYDFDEHKNPVVVHKKTQVVRNDGCVEWAGALHEDFKENRALNVQFVEGIDRMHFTNEERVKIAQKRNVEVSLADAKNNPDDPRVYFNLANSYFGADKPKQAKTAFTKFIALSNSEDEKYIAYQRLASVEHALNNREKAIEYLQLCIGMKPDVPDAYHQLGYICFEYNMLNKAEEYVLWGLAMKPKYHKMIVYNPRDYDYNPMMMLAKIYFNKSRPDLALPLLKGCLKIYPHDDYLKTITTEMEQEAARMSKVISIVEKLEGVEDRELIRKEIDSLSIDLQSHPAICRIRNRYFTKTESSGKDITYYCGETKHEWNPVIAQTQGIGGSEEAVLNLSKQWAKLGYNVTVYNSCGPVPMEVEGVTYKPFWHYNPKDKTDITILWRTPRVAEHELNTTKIFVDLHDVIPAGEFNEKRLKKIDKIFVKTNFHRSLFPNVPDEKFAVIPNGLELYTDESIEKDPYLLINTSSPDRSLDVLPKLFKEIKKEVPEAKMAWAYGWEIFDNAHSDNKEMMAWKQKTLKEMDEAGVETLGRLPQSEVGRLYQKAGIFFYPTNFAEIHCISVCKAQVSGCIAVTSDFAALAETNELGYKTHSNKTKDNWCKNFQFHFGADDEKEQKELVRIAVEQLKNPAPPTQASIEKLKSKLLWKNIAKDWINALN